MLPPCNYQNLANDSIAYLRTTAAAAIGSKVIIDNMAATSAVVPLHGSLHVCAAKVCVPRLRSERNQSLLSSKFFLSRKCGYHRVSNYLLVKLFLYCTENGSQIISRIPIPASFVLKDYI